MSVLSSGGILGAALSLSVTTIGAGVLAIPSTLQDGGIFFVLFILVSVAMLTVLSIDYLIQCVDVLHLRSYEDISRELLGKMFEEAIRWILIVYTIGIAAGYIVVIGEIFTPMLPLLQPYIPFLSSPSRIMLVAWVSVLLPLSFVQHINHIHFISALAITATITISAVIIYRYFVPVEVRSPQHATFEMNYLSLNAKALLALPVMMFSFDCQSLVFQIYSNLAKPTRRNMFRVAVISVAVTGGMYVLVGLFGYLSNAPNITGNILSNYNPLKDHLFAAATCLYSVTIGIAYVLVLFPCRDAVFILLYGYNSATHELAHDAITAHQSFFVTLTISVLSILIALKASGIVYIIALLGGLCSSTLCFCYPASFRLALHLRGICPCSRAGLVLALGMLCFGIVGGVLGTAITLWTL